MKRYTVKEVAKLSKVTIRTLHHYDDIGLLKPAGYRENGYRFYETEQLLMLQQILLYKRMGMSLEETRALIHDPNFDKLSALLVHRSNLQNEAQRVEQLIATVDKTIQTLQGNSTISNHDLYLGFPPETQAAYERELTDTWGEAAESKIIESKKRMQKWSPHDFQKSGEENERLMNLMVDQIVAGESPNCDTVQQITKLHYQWICRFWTPDQQAYIGLGNLYVTHTDFQKFYEKFHPKLAQFLSSSMQVFAMNSLTNSGFERGQ